MKLQKILILLEKQLEAIEAPVLKKLNAGINSREMLQKEGLPDCLLNCTQCINGRMAPILGQQTTWVNYGCLILEFFCGLKRLYNCTKKQARK